MNIKAILKAQSVKRWHTNDQLPAEPLGHHHATVALLALYLMEDYEGDLLDGYSQSNVLTWALLHDVHEGVLGDPPATAKRMFPDFAKRYDEASQDIEDQFGLTHYRQQLSEPELYLIRLCDKMAAILHVKRHKKKLLKRDDWQEDIAEVKKIAQSFGYTVSRKIKELLE